MFDDTVGKWDVSAQVTLNNLVIQGQEHATGKERPCTIKSTPVFKSVDAV